MFDRTAIAWAICRAATPENLLELSAYGNAGPFADAVISTIHNGMHAGGVSNRPLNATALATPSSSPVAECPLSPNGRHQVDTSMESGPNNCFYCEASMEKRNA